MNIFQENKIILSDRLRGAGHCSVALDDVSCGLVVHLDKTVFIEMLRCHVWVVEEPHAHRGRKYGAQG